VHKTSTSSKHTTKNGNKPLMDIEPNLRRSGTGSVTLLFISFQKRTVHDGELLTLVITDGSRPASLSEPEVNLVNWRGWPPSIARHSEGIGQLDQRRAHRRFRKDRG
jgi:hypothetical protein